MGNVNHLRNHYSKEGMLGSGAFARVYLVKHKKTKVKYAAKSIPKSKLDEDMRKLVDGEIKILKQIKHPNCCNLVEYFESDKKVYLIQELMRGPTLYHRFAQHEYISEWHVAMCIQKIARAIKYLHSKGIVHRDLKPQNIMFAKPPKEDETMESLKILDFGFAKRIDRDGYTTSSRGTPRYVAPEVVITKEGKIEYGTSCDIWSLGVIMYELLSGVPPFPDKQNLREYFKQLRKPKVVFPKRYWNDVSSEAKELILGMLARDPDKRLTADQVLKHAWLKSFDDEESKEGEISRAATERNTRLKMIIFRTQLHRVVHFVRMFIRYRHAVDTLLRVCTGGKESVNDANITELLKRAARETPKEEKGTDAKKFTRVESMEAPMVSSYSELRRVCKMLRKKTNEKFPVQIDTKQEEPDYMAEKPKPAVQASPRVEIQSP